MLDLSGTWHARHGLGKDIWLSPLLAGMARALQAGENYNNHPVASLIWYEDSVLDLHDAVEFCKM